MNHQNSQDYEVKFSSDIKRVASFMDSENFAHLGCTLTGIDPDFGGEGPPFLTIEFLEKRNVFQSSITYRGNQSALLKLGWRAPNSENREIHRIYDADTSHLVIATDAFAAFGIALALTEKSR